MRDQLRDTRTFTVSYTYAVRSENRMPQSWTLPPVQFAPVQPGINWEPLFWTAVGLGTVALLTGAFDGPAPRRCGTCGKSGHDTRRCSQNAAKRVRLRIAKTGWCKLLQSPIPEDRGPPLRRTSRRKPGPRDVRELPLGLRSRWSLAEYGQEPALLPIVIIAVA